MAHDQDKDRRRFLDRLKKGDPALFREWVRQTRPIVEATVASVVGGGSEVHDLVQETYIRAYRKIRSVRSPGALDSWLRRTARNVAPHHLRRRKVQQKNRKAYRRDAAEAWTEPPGVDDTFVHRRERMRRLVDALPDDQREVILLRYYAGLTYKRVAETLGVPLTTVDGRVRQAKQALFEMMQEDEDDTP